MGDFTEAYEELMRAVDAFKFELLKGLDPLFFAMAALIRKVRK